jgi:hypothetical protein
VIWVAEVQRSLREEIAKLIDKKLQY